MFRVEWIVIVSKLDNVRLCMHSFSLVVIVDRNEKDARDAFNASIDGGLTFFDTAEVYGSGVSVYLF